MARESYMSSIMPYNVKNYHRKLGRCWSKNKSSRYNCEEVNEKLFQVGKTDYFRNLGEPFSIINLSNQNSEPTLYAIGCQINSTKI